MKKLKLILLVPLSLMFLGGGVNHFLDTDFYLKMMPPYLPLHKELIWISGIFEIAVGVGVWIKKYRAWSAWGMVALLVAVFPANIHMYQNPDLFPDIPESGLLIRLPIQGLLIAWAMWMRKE